MIKSWLILLIIVGYHIVCEGTNVIFILADDLGYGDLGFAPFTSTDFKGIQTPHLHRLAKSGLVLTNFHAASAVCSPSRASILTGLFPWRLGIDFIYSQDKKLDGSEELDHEQLPLLANIPMTMRNMGLYTAHVGKWHLGGITHADIGNRNNGNCSVPGINQYGFDEYVAMTEGFDSMRYWTQQRKETYVKGADHLFRNDQPLAKVSPTPWLTDKQTDEALRVMREQAKRNRPFFVNLWYDAPHSPWEAVEPYYTKYQSSFKSEVQRKYASMITNMDANIGRILDTVESLGIAEDTLIFFTSDNGPEMDVGSAGPFKGKKRLLLEGGIRVPAIASWKGKIPAGSTSDAFMLTTDLFPTFIAAAAGDMPSNIRIDGFSFLPVLQNPSQKKIQIGDERVVLWYTHSIGYPKFTAARAFGFKIIWADYEGRKGKNLPASWRVFDMVNDPYEVSNLYSTFQTHCEAANTLSLSPSSEKLAWSEIERHKIDVHSLNLLRHLQVAMYLFRFEGERDWLTYHENKPFETSPHCQLRTLLSAERLTHFSHILQPQFCGKSIAAEKVTGCVCAFEDCAGRWLSANTSSSNLLTRWWTEDAALTGVTHYAPIKGTLLSHVNSVLKWARHSGVCPTATLQPLFDSLTRSSLPKLLSQQSQCEDHVDLHSAIAATTHSHSNHSSISSGQSRGNMASKEKGFAFGDFVGHNWQRTCHQRVHFDALTRQYYLTSSTCSLDMPVMQVNMPGMPRAVNVCPESLERMMSPVPADNFMDDNILLGILNLVLLSIVGAKGEEDIVLRPRAERNLGVIDPLFFHFAGVDHQPSLLQVKLFSAEQLQQRTQELWGFVRDFKRRLDNSCVSDCLDFSVWPYHIQDYYWGITIAHHPVHAPDQLRLIHILPATSAQESEYANSNEEVAKVAEKFIAEVLRQTRHVPSLDKMTVSAQTIQSTYTGLIPSLETMKVIVLLKLSARFFQQSTGQQTAGLLESLRKVEKKLPLNTIFSERKKLIDFFIFQGREVFQNRKKTIRFMSSPKFE